MSGYTQTTVYVSNMSKSLSVKEANDHYFSKYRVAYEKNKTVSQSSYFCYTITIPENSISKCKWPLGESDVVDVMAQRSRGQIY